LLELFRHLEVITFDLLHLVSFKVLVGNDTGLVQVLQTLETFLPHEKHLSFVKVTNNCEVKSCPVVPVNRLKPCIPPLIDLDSPVEFIAQNDNIFAILGKFDHLNSIFVAALEARFKFRFKLVISQFAALSTLIQFANILYKNFRRVAVTLSKS